MCLYLKKQEIVCLLILFPIVVPIALVYYAVVFACLLVLHIREKLYIRKFKKFLQTKIQEYSTNNLSYNINVVNFTCNLFLLQNNLLKTKRDYGSLTVSYRDSCGQKRYITIGALIDDIMRKFVVLKKCAIKVKVFVELEGKNKITANLISKGETDTGNDIIFKCDELLVDIYEKIEKLHDIALSNFVSVKADLFYLCSSMDLLIINCMTSMKLIMQEKNYTEELCCYSLIGNSVARG